MDKCKILGLALALMTLEALAAKVERDPVTGTTSIPCGKDGVCNIGACNTDPDCPANTPPSSGTSYPTETVTTNCGGSVEVLGSETPLGQAAADMARRYPDFNTTQKAKDPSYFDAHPSGVLATGHAELGGFGVTMIQGNWPKPVGNATSKLGNPTLLFFQKTDKKQDYWNIIGMGYTFEFATENMSPPTKLAEIPAHEWWIHEAGYHHSPGDGGFTCAKNDDLKNKVFNAGKRIDSAGCEGIAKGDLKTREFKLDSKHGRYWTVHVWIDPSTRRPTLQKTDPWCRQSKDALSVPRCAFFQRNGSCP